MPENFYGSPLLEPLATACIERGWAMVSGNNRGHDYVADIAVAGSPATYRRIGNTWEHFPDCVVDIKSWIGACPTPRVTLMGHSLGASKVAYYMAETADPLVDALVVSGPVDMPRFFQHTDPDYAVRVAEARRMMATGRGEERISRATPDGHLLSARTYLELFQPGGANDIFDTQHPGRETALARITVPILAMCGEKDDCVILDPETELAMARQHARRCRRFESAVIPGTGHGYEGREGDAARLVVDWMTGQTEARQSMP
jgi:pimeloyl-ACP methyl ester carboxylesterase